MSLYTMIGAMSGTSMDGLDLVLCEIREEKEDQYSYKILNTRTFQYPSELLHLLERSKSLSSPQLYELDKNLGKHFSTCINDFLKDSQTVTETITAIASHGHTVFHQPEKGFTVQIGCGITMASITGIPVINDFRQRDVISGGQGAPLVPIGDKMLFDNRADAFLNIGGFTNISIPGELTIAFDISPGNLPLNLIANEMGLAYDDKGTIAQSGALDQNVLNQLNALDFYHLEAPKSLGTEWLETHFLPVLATIPDLKDRMHTCVIHIADQISKICTKHSIKRLFITGGGAFNTFLIHQLRERGIEPVLPSKDEINFKEALIFAFLGVRFLEEKHNCLSSVTGASHNVCGGTLHRPE